MNEQSLLACLNKFGQNNVEYECSMTECSMGQHGLGQTNEYGEILANMCDFNSLVIRDSFIPHKSISTKPHEFHQMKKLTENQIDHS